MRKSILLSTLSLTLTLILARMVWAETRPVLKMCVAAETRDQTWGKTIADPLTQPWNERQIKATLVLLPRLRASSTLDLKPIENHLAKDFARTYPNWDRIVRDDCTMARLHLLRPLINAAKNNGKLRLRVQNEILDELRAPRASALIISMVGFIVLQHALDQKIWAVDASFSHEFAATRVKMKEKISAWQKEYPPDRTPLDMNARQILYLDEVKRSREVRRILNSYLDRLPTPSI